MVQQSSQLPQLQARDLCLQALLPEERHQFNATFKMVGDLHAWEEEKRHQVITLNLMVMLLLLLLLLFQRNACVLCLLTYGRRRAQTRWPARPTAPEYP